MPASGPAGLWLAIGAQAVIVAAIVLRTVRKMLPDASGTLCVVLVVTTALFSSLPWHTSQLMPDAFTGALVLLAWLAASRDADLPGTPSLWLCTGVLALLHYTHLPLLAITVLTTFGLAAIGGTALRRIGKRVAAASITIIAIVAAHVAVNGLLFDRWTVSPLGGWFLFARVHQDGLADDWLVHHCGRDAPEALCKLGPSLPKDSQTLLWSASSPIYQKIEGEIATPAYWRWTNMLGNAAMGSIRDEPMAFIKYSTLAAGRQFLSFSVLDDHCTAGCQPTALFRFRPSVEISAKSSRQLTDEMHADRIRFVTQLAAIAALTAMLPLIIIAVRRRDNGAVSFLVTILISLIANAAITGALSDVQPRYQSRVVWLAMFSALIVMARWSLKSLRSERKPAPTHQF